MKSNEVKGRKIAIELLNGTKIFGRVHSWGTKYIWVLEKGHKKPIDVPKDIIVRSLVLFEEVFDDKEEN